MASNNTSAKATKRRRNYVINPSFQWRHSITIALAVFLVSSIISCVLYGVLHHQARMRMINPANYTAEVTGVILLFAVVFSALTAGGVGLWFMLVTHRICGPMHVLKRHLSELAHGRFPQIRPLRRKDEFKDLFATFQEAIDFLKMRRQYELNALSEVMQTVDDAAAQSNGEDSDAFRSVADQLRKIRKEAAFLIEDAEPVPGASGSADAQVSDRPVEACAAS